MIIIVSTPDNPRGQHTARALDRRGVRHAFFTPANLPREVTLAYGFDGRSPAATLTCEGRRIDLTAIRSIYYVRSSRPEPHPEIRDERQRGFIADECMASLHDMYLALQLPWVPGPPAQLETAQYKGLGLRLATEEGLTVPKTLVTNDPDAARDFYLRNRGAIIRKQVGPWQIMRSFPEHARYTDVVSPRDIGYLSSLRYCPMILQEYVPKQFEVRATVVGERVFAASIASQVSNRAKHDWRRYDNGNTKYAQYQLPQAVARACLRIVRRMDLSYGAIDLIVTPDDDHVFLEVNPVGEYLWIENRAQLPITEAICDLLIAGGSPSKLQPLEHL